MFRYTGGNLMFSPKDRNLMLIFKANRQTPTVMKNLLRRSKATKVGLALITLLFLITVFLNLQKGPALKHLERLLWSDRIYPNDNGIEEGKDTFKSAESDNIKRVQHLRRECEHNGDDVTFFEFVQYLTDDKTERFDHHWEKYTTLCHPCIVKYDFIGKYETISRDADFILKDIEAPPEIRFPKRSERYSNVETIKTFNTYYSRIPAECIAKLWNIYRMDFELFGYSISDNFKMIPNA
ncbi:Carbohydrate sulfotransferase 14 [Mizuhopecten yessoensis]|uniref:Carbohydrate sulfotransferase n=1 Tax=Mizuhopecten yessoensis TaxID=6573 RepID=A0A210PE00_MIZYE|nr:Carbohydrate sulfotransferase 14 [Mizuhopecten yessoensis]